MSQPDGDDGAKVVDLASRRPVRDTSFEVELDEEPPPTHEPVYVDVVSREHTRRPVIPANLRGWANVQATVRHNLGRWTHIAAYHLVRCPRYAALAGFWSVVGVGRLALRQIQWWWLSEASSMRQSAATSDDYATWERNHKQVKATRHFRGWVLTGEVLGLTVAGSLLYALAPAWLDLLVVAALVPPLAHIGRPLGRPIITPAIVTPRYRKLNADIVLRAYYAAKLGDPDKRPVRFGSPMSRDAMNSGSQVVVDLDYGFTFADVVNARSKLASGLDVTDFQVFLTRDKTSTRRHLLYVADRDPLAIPAGRTPMLDGKPRDVWKPCYFGLDERGRKVCLDLLWNSILIGAQPRKGKTFSARLLALYAALDPWVTLIVADGKNSPDWRKFALVAHRIIFGTTPTRDGDAVDLLLETLREVKRHIQTVNDVLSRLPVDVCPDGKLTRELARDPRYPDLRVWMLVMEEFQVYFELEDQEQNKEIASLLSFIQAVGPSAGVIILSSSQKPSGVGAGDVQRLFNRYRDNHAVRFALKCGNRLVSEAVLGGDAYGEGYDASSLPIGPEYRGVGYLYGASDDTPTVRTHLADAQDAEKILLTARRLREAAGTLTGMAAGEDVARQVRDVLADVRSVFYAGEAWISWQQLATRLAEQAPEHYADTSRDAISAQVRAFGVSSKDGREGDRILKGLRLREVEQAIQRREIEGR